VPLKVGALWVGLVTGGEGWTLTHHEGLTAAAAQLPYVSFTHRENVVVTKSIVDSVDELVKGGASVVIANSFSQRDAILEKAKQYPNVKFLTCASYESNGKNAISYAAHSEQPWYVAGKVAARVTKSNHLGYIGSFITPEVVRHINAFHLGARSINADIKLEVAWLGFWYDYNVEKTYRFKHADWMIDEPVYREELLAYRLLEDGADVVAHGADNQRSVRLIERLHARGLKVWSFSNDNRNGCRELTADSLPNGPAMKSCIGSPYFNWGPLYGRILDQVHRGTFVPSVNFNEPMLGTADSIAGFQLNPTIGIDDSAVRSYVNAVAANGWQSVFIGPYKTTGQRDKDNDGKPDAVQSVEKDERMTDDEYRRMCWFADGIVERSDPSVAGNLVPAKVPDADRLGDVPWVRDILSPPGIADADKGIGLDCNKNY
jgi:simple sugar transport system substrate-binding protein